jgi:hypothetical protein
MHMPSMCIETNYAILYNQRLNVICLRALLSDLSRIRAPTYENTYQTAGRMWELSRVTSVFLVGAKCIYS